MRNRGSSVDLVLSLLAFWFFMPLVLGIVGFGVGLPEMVVWLVLTTVGIVLIVRRHDRARRPA